MNTNFIDDLITYFTLADEERSTVKTHHASLASYKAALPLFAPQYHLMKNSADYDDNTYSEHYSPAFLKRSWDVSLLFPVCDPGHYKDAKFSIGRFQKIPIQMLRGERLASPHAGLLAVGLFTESGQFVHSYKSYWNWQGRKWVQVVRNGWECDLNENEVVTQRRFSFFLQEHQYVDHFWHVSLGYPDSLQLKLRTDNEGAREAFKLREIPPGKTRRAALKHWVSQHYRERPSTGMKDVNVKSHLRGAEEFTWDGMKCKIEPPLAVLHHLYPARFPEPERWPEDQRVSH